MKPLNGGTSTHRWALAAALPSPQCLRHLGLARRLSVLGCSVRREREKRGRQNVLGFGGGSRPRFCSSGNEGQPFDRDGRSAMNGLRNRPRWRSKSRPRPKDAAWCARALLHEMGCGPNLSLGWIRAMIIVVIIIFQQK
jgi:hypothetical protein